MGKSLYVKKKAVSLSPAMSNGSDICVTIPIHGPVVTADTLMDYFKKYAGRENCTIYHLDIAPRVSILDVVILNASRRCVCVCVCVCVRVRVCNAMKTNSFYIGF